MPTTVPGIANDSSVPNSKARLPAKSWRESSHAVSSPIAAVSGAASRNGQRGAERGPGGAGEMQPALGHLDGEAGEEVIQREAVVAPDGLHEAADEDRGIDDQRERGPRQRDAVAEPAQARGSGTARPASPLPVTVVYDARPSQRCCARTRPA